MGAGHSPWAQVVQAVLGFHVDRWDPGTDADRERERENTTLNYCVLLTTTAHYLRRVIRQLNFQQQSELKRNITKAFLWTVTQTSTELLLPLRAMHVPGVLNSRGVDAQSQNASPSAGEIWMGIHRFLRKNAQYPLFFFSRNKVTLQGADILAHSWRTCCCTCSPLLSLVAPVLLRVRKHPRAGRLWMAELVQLLHSQPWLLVLCRDLVSQVLGQLYHSCPEWLALWAWHVRTFLWVISVPLPPGNPHIHLFGFTTLTVPSLAHSVLSVGSSSKVQKRTFDYQGNPLLWKLSEVSYSTALLACVRARGRNTWEYSVWGHRQL